MSGRVLLFHGRHCLHDSTGAVGKGSPPLSNSNYVLRKRPLNIKECPRLIVKKLG